MPKESRVDKFKAGSQTAIMIGSMGLMFGGHLSDSWMILAAGGGCFLFGLFGLIRG